MNAPAPYRRYKRPPIGERVISAFCSMDTDEFPAKFDSWRGKVRDAFPFDTPRVVWDINIEDKAGVPVLAKGGPTMRIRHWFHEYHPKESRGFAQQCEVGRMGINLLKDGDKVFQFQDIESKFKEWLPIWAHHFGVQSFHGFALDYVNFLNPRTVPSFCTAGKIHIGKVFKLFSSIPGPHITLIPPYDCEVNLLLDEKMPASGRIQVRAAGADGLRVDMQMRSVRESKEVTIEQGFDEVLALHQWMVTYFEVLFTDEAKESFEPIQ